MSFIFTLLLSLPTYAAPQPKVANCFTYEVDLYVATKGRLPTDDEADLLIDFCMAKWEHKREQREEESKDTPHVEPNLGRSEK